MVSQVKDLDFYTLSAGPTWTFKGHLPVAFVEFRDGYLYYLNDQEDTYVALSGVNTALLPTPFDEVRVRPYGATYPGHSTPGNGGKHVEVGLTTGGAGPVQTIIMEQCEDAVVDAGWVIINKGDFVIAYTPAKILWLVTS